MSPTIRRKVEADLAGSYARAREIAAAGAIVHEPDLIRRLPKTCPYDWDAVWHRDVMAEAGIDLSAGDGRAEETPQEESLMAQQAFDLVVIGGGPGGYVAAIRAAQLGMRTALVEREHLGGICLNWGCIPTKALLRSAELFHQMQHLDEFGFVAKEVSYDFPKVIQRSRKVAGQLNRGVQHLLRKNKVDRARRARAPRRQGQGRGREGRRRAPRRSRRRTSSSRPARARARCPASSRTAG